MTSMPDTSDPARPSLGDPAGWLRDHGDALYAYARARVRDAEAAEDLVQETLLAALDARSSFAGGSAPRTWLIGILRHKLVDRLRRAAREEATAAMVEDQFTRSGKWRHGPQRWPDGEEVPDGPEFVAALESCLARLPERLAETFVLCAGHEVGIGPASELMETTHGNVSVMLYRARSALRRCLEHTWLGRAREGG